MNKWFAPQIGRSAPVPDLSGAGLALLGGRIVPGASAPAAFLVYETGDRERIGLAIEAIDSPPASGVDMREIGGVVGRVVEGGNGFIFAVAQNQGQAHAGEGGGLSREQDRENA